jgi:hypothetical protein
LIENFCERSAGAQAGIVDDYVNAAGVTVNLLEQRDDLRTLYDIGLVGNRPATRRLDICDGLFCPSLAVRVVSDNGCTFLRQPFCYFRSDSPSRPRHEGDLPC